MYLILTAESEFETRSFTDIGEGPFDNVQQALCFAHCEVGVPWIVLEDGRPMCYGDARGELLASGDGRLWRDNPEEGTVAYVGK